VRIHEIKNGLDDLILRSVMTYDSGMAFSGGLACWAFGVWRRSSVSRLAPLPSERFLSFQDGSGQFEDGIAYLGLVVPH